jgi:hypothetical protein
MQVRGKKVVIAVVALLALLVVPPALARGPGGGGGEVATAAGTILSIDGDELTFVIDVIKSNGLVDADPLLVLTTDDTHFKVCYGGYSEPGSFSDLVVGLAVRLDGTMAGDDLIARRVTIYQ